MDILHMCISRCCSLVVRKFLEVGLLVQSVNASVFNQILHVPLLGWCLPLCFQKGQDACFPWPCQQYTVKVWDCLIWRDENDSPVCKLILHFILLRGSWMSFHLFKPNFCVFLLSAVILPFIQWVILIKMFVWFIILLIASAFLLC